MPTSMRITHHVGDQCPNGHFDQASLRECAAWLVNRLDSGPERDSGQLRLTALVRMMRRAGWQYGTCEYFDAARHRWVKQWAFNCPGATLGGELTEGGDGGTELAIYRTACLALYTHPTLGQAKSGVRQWTA